MQSLRKNPCSLKSFFGDHPGENPIAPICLQCPRTKHWKEEIFTNRPRALGAQFQKEGIFVPPPHPTIQLNTNAVTTLLPTFINHFKNFSNLIVLRCQFQCRVSPVLIIRPPQQYGLYGILSHPKYFVTDLYKDWVGGTGRGNDQMSDAIKIGEPRLDNSL